MKRRRRHDLSLAEASRRVGVTSATLKRWAEDGVVQLDGEQWTNAAVAHAIQVARLRDRGHSLEEIKKAMSEGRLATALVEELLRSDGGMVDLKTAAKQTGLEPALIERIWTSIGIPPGSPEMVDSDDLEALHKVAQILAAGFPLVALLQLMRVYGQNLRQIADAETHLVHMYVHEPLIKEGVPGHEMAEEMEGLVGDVLPLTTPLMDFVHRKFLGYYIEQDVVGHMEDDPDTEELGRLKVAIGFADLAGFTRFTEEAGEDEALDVVERFIRQVEESMPDEARVVKTIGDEVMVVCNDPLSLTQWAVDFQKRFKERPLPRIGMHYGATIYRDGDYFGSEVNLAARITARALAGEVLASKPLKESCLTDEGLKFNPIGKVGLKGFSKLIPLYTVTRKRVRKR